MRLLLYCTVILLCLLVFASTAIASGDGGEEPLEMSLSTVVLFALNNNPDILMAEERVYQMEEYTEEAKAEYWPRIEFEVKGGREYISPVSGQTTNNYGKAVARLNQKIFDGYATSSEVNRRESVKDMANIETSLKRNEVILDTLGYYLDVLMYQSQVQTLESYDLELSSIVNNIKSMYKNGAVSKVMNDYAMSRLASSRQGLSKAKSSLNDAMSNLEFLTGPLPVFTAYKPDNLMPEKYAFDYYFELMDRKHLNVELNRKEIEAMKYKLNAEKAAYLPSIDFNITAEEKHNDGGDVGSVSDVKATFKLSYEIFDGFLRKHKTNRIHGQVKELEFKKQKIVNELKKDLKLSYNQILAARSSLDSVHSEIVNNITVKLLNTQNFQQGNINIIELIEGEERLKDSYLKKHEFIHNLYLGKYTLLINSTLLKANYFCVSCSGL